MLIIKNMYVDLSHVVRASWTRSENTVVLELFSGDTRLIELSSREISNSAMDTAFPLIVEIISEYRKPNRKLSILKFSSFENMVDAILSRAVVV